MFTQQCFRHSARRNLWAEPAAAAVAPGQNTRARARAKSIGMETLLEIANRFKRLNSMIARREVCSSIQQCSVKRRRDKDATRQSQGSDGGSRRLQWKQAPISRTLSIEDGDNFYNVWQAIWYYHCDVTRDDSEIETLPEAAAAEPILFALLIPCSS